MTKIKVVVVDDHQVVRQGLVALLQLKEEFQVVGETGSVRELMEIVRSSWPDVILMDVRMPGESGIEACRLIRERFPQVKVLMLTSYSDEEEIIASILAGASGYVLKDTDVETLFKDIKLVSEGHCLLDPAITDKVFHRINAYVGKDKAPELVKLTQQERRVLQLIAEGKTNHEIARTLHVSDKTVRNYVSNLLSKLNLENRTQAAVYSAKYLSGK